LRFPILILSVGIDGPLLAFLACSPASAFFPPRNMETYLREAGFDPIVWHNAKAHQATDAISR
jgi:hypothetical protein